MKRLVDCSDLPEGRLYEICTGVSELARRKENGYRQRWGLSPLPDEEEDMNTPCKFIRLPNGWWRCTNAGCDYVHRRASRRPPVRLCGTPPPPIARKPRTQRPRKMSAPKPGAVHTTLELGDLITKGLTAVGITDERVSAFLGKPCGCPKRREKLNQLSRWAKRILRGDTDDAKKHLEDIIGG